VAKRSWSIDELAHAGEHHLRPDFVDGYDGKASFDPGPDLALLRQLGLSSASCLVDLGAGTGELALAAAEICRRVVAVDVSSPMLAVARLKAERRGMGNLELANDGFLSYQHQGALADFVYTRNALHHLPDFWKVVALRRIAAISRPGGVLLLRDLVFCCEPAQVEDAIEDWLRAASGDREEGWTRAEIEADVRDEHITFSWLLEPMLTRVGFEIREVAHSDSRVFASYVCVNQAPSS
jgi:SAM-dependent methyltransferase